MPRRRGLASLGPDAAAGGAGRGEPALRARLGHWPACWAKAGAPLPAGSRTWVARSWPAPAFTEQGGRGAPHPGRSVVLRQRCPIEMHNAIFG